MGRQTEETNTKNYNLKVAKLFNELLLNVNSHRTMAWNSRLIKISKIPPETFEHFHNITKHNVIDDIVFLNALYSVFFSLLTTGLAGV